MPETRNKGKRPSNREGLRSSQGGGKRQNYDETLKRPSGWMPHVEASVCAAAEKEEVNGETLYICPINNQLYKRKDMAIDHIIPWEQYCRTHAEVTNPISVKEVYNDTTNLRLVSKSGNSSKGNKTRVQF
jgi:hypothetical protein